MGTANEEALGVSSAPTLASAERLAALYEATGKDAQAMPLRRRLLENNEARLGQTSPQEAAARGRLASTLEGLGRVEEAEALKRKLIPEDAFSAPDVERSEQGYLIAGP